MVREEGKLELGEGGTKGNRNKRQTIYHRERRSTQFYSNDSTRAIHGEEQVDTRVYVCILVMY